MGTWAGVIIAAAGAYTQYQSAESAGDAAHNAAMEREAQARYAKEIADAEAAAAKEAATANANQIEYNAERFKKTQRAMAAKAGLDVNKGSAVDLRKETDALARRDVQTVLGDAGRQASLFVMKGKANSSSLLSEASAMMTTAKANTNAAAVGGVLDTADSTVTYKTNREKAGKSGWYGD